jgi:hypothetical protein
VANRREGSHSPRGGSVPSKGRCRGCGEVGEREWAVVRLYRRRTQVEFRYHVCQDCMRILSTFLEGNAEVTSRSMFDHSAGVTATKALEQT